jgi:hypothetical protein
MQKLRQIGCVKCKILAHHRRGVNAGKCEKMKKGLLGRKIV